MILVFALLAILLWSMSNVAWEEGRPQWACAHSLWPMLMQLITST